MATNSYRVLIIAEEPKEVELYSRLIREVVRCKLDVLTRLEASMDWIPHSNYHLVVIDSSQKNAEHDGQAITGINVLEQIKRISPSTGVVIVTDQTSVDEAVAAIRIGAEDYFKKPFNIEKFRLAVKRGLDRKTVFGEHTGASNFLNLLNTCQMISAYMEEAKIFALVKSFIEREVKSPCAALYHLDKNGSPVHTNLSEDEADDREEDADRAMEEILDIALLASNPLSGMIAENEIFRFLDRGQLTPSLFIFRFRCAGNQDQFAVCLSPKVPDNMGAFETRLRMLHSQIEVTGKNIEQYRGVEQLVYLDDATGLYNTRYLHTILDQEIHRSAISKKPFAVLFLDADRFKAVNDAHGHSVGTKLLNELGAHLKKLVRDTDTVFRYGGDEFVAVLSECDLKTAEIAAERIRASVEKKDFLVEEGLNLHFTVSIGVALFPDHAKSKAEIIAAADHAMYAAKKTTRNSVSIAPIPHAS